MLEKSRKTKQGKEMWEIIIYAQEKLRNVEYILNSLNAFLPQ